MANITPKTSPIVGAAIGVSVPITTAASAGGDTFDNDGRTIIVVKNGSGAPITVTFDSLTPSNYGTDVNPAAAIPAGATYFFGPLDPNRFNDANGRVGVSYSGVTSLTVDSFRI